MSFGFYRVENYEIRFSAGRMEVRTPEQAFFKINAFNPHVPYAPELEDALLTLEPITPLLAKVTTPRHILLFVYYEDPDQPNGQINLSEKIVGSDVDNVLAFQNSVPREVILTLASMVSGTEHCQQYRVGEAFAYIPPANNNNNNNNGNPWNNGNSTISNNEPRSVRNYNSNTNRNNFFNGGKRRKNKTRRGKRRT